MTKSEAFFVDLIISGKCSHLVGYVHAGLIRRTGLMHDVNNAYLSAVPIRNNQGEQHRDAEGLIRPLASTPFLAFPPFHPTLQEALEGVSRNARLPLGSRCTL